MLEVIKNSIWNPFTVFALIAIGIVIMVKTHFYTVIKLPEIFRKTIFSLTKNRNAFALMCTSLGGTIGVGNAVGVAGAIAEGGAGAVFWMAIAGFFGMAIKYAEIFFSISFKSDDRRSVGAISYIEKASGIKSVAYIYAFLCIGVSLGMGNMSQVEAATTSFYGILKTPKYIPSLLFVVLFVAIAKGGLKKIKGFSEIAVPFLSIIYIILLVVILISRSNYLFDTFELIAEKSGIVSGIKWAAIKKGLTGGFCKSIFSSEAGLGSAGFAHTESECTPNEQAKWGVIEVFIDTLICLLTALALLSYKSEIVGAPQSFMTRAIFALSFGKVGEVFYGFSMLLFAFASIISWYYYGSCAIRFITSKKSLQQFYFIIFAVLIFISSFVSEGIITDLSDIANGLMMTLNISALWVLLFKNPLTF